MPRVRLALIASCLAALSTACAGGDGPATVGPGPGLAEPAASPAFATANPPADAAPLLIDVPAGAGSRLPALHAGADDRLRLAWVEPDAGPAHAVRLATWDGTAWSAATTVAVGEDVVTHWTAAPAVAALEDGTMAVQWVAASHAGAMGTDVRLAVSADGGATWSGPASPHGPAKEAENGFAGLVPQGDGFLLLWLDARLSDISPTDAHGEPPDVALRASRVDRRGAASGDTVLDPRVCECCALDAAGLENGEIRVAYRDRSAENLRDVAIVGFDGETWSPGQTVHAAGWQADFCPVNGPALDVDGERVAVAWFTGPIEGPATVSLAFSEDGGKRFGPPLQVDDGRPLGHVDVALLPGGSAAVSWLEAGDLRVRQVGPGPRLAPGWAARVPKVSIEHGRPRLARFGAELFLAWATGGPAGAVRLARLP